MPCNLSRASRGFRVLIKARLNRRTGVTRAPRASTLKCIFVAISDPSHPSFFPKNDQISGAIGLGRISKLRNWECARLLTGHKKMQVLWLEDRIRSPRAIVEEPMQPDFATLPVGAIKYAFFLALRSHFPWGGPHGFTQFVRKIKMPLSQHHSKERFFRIHTKIYPFKSVYSHACRKLKLVVTFAPKFSICRWVHWPIRGARTNLSAVTRLSISNQFRRLSARS